MMLLLLQFQVENTINMLLITLVTSNFVTIDSAYYIIHEYQDYPVIITPKESLTVSPKYSGDIPAIGYYDQLRVITINGVPLFISDTRDKKFPLTRCLKRSIIATCRRLSSPTRPYSSRFFPWPFWPI